jgi:hypothetical protein
MPIVGMAGTGADNAGNAIKLPVNAVGGNS